MGGRGGGALGGSGGGALGGGGGGTITVISNTSFGLSPFGTRARMSPIGVLICIDWPPTTSSGTVTRIRIPGASGGEATAGETGEDAAGEAAVDAAAGGAGDAAAGGRGDAAGGGGGDAAGGGGGDAASGGGGDAAGGGEDGGGGAGEVGGGAAGEPGGGAAGDADGGGGEACVTTRAVSFSGALCVAFCAGLGNGGFGGTFPVAAAFSAAGAFVSAPTSDVLAADAGGGAVFRGGAAFGVGAAVRLRGAVETLAGLVATGALSLMPAVALDSLGAAAAAVFFAAVEVAFTFGSGFAPAVVLP